MKNKIIEPKIIEFPVGNFKNSDDFKRFAKNFYHKKLQRQLKSLH